MVDNPIEKIVNKSFLSRVPEIMAAHPELPIEDAVRQAYDADEAFCIRMQLANEGGRQGLDQPAEEVIRVLSAGVYHRLREDK